MGFTTGDKLRNYSTGSMFMGQLLTVAYLVFLVDQIPFHKRVYWALCLDHSLRGVGWNWVVANIPPPPKSPRWNFVREQLFRAVRCFLLLDLARSYMYLDPLFSLTGADARSITSQGYALCCLNIIAWGYTPYGMTRRIGLIHLAPGVTRTLFGASGGEPCCPFCSHALVRCFGQATMAPDNATARLPSYGFATGHNRFFVRSALSWLHRFWDHALLRWRPNGRHSASFPFFLVQAVAITFEDTVIATGKYVGSGEGFRRLRVVRFMWFSVSMPLCIDGRSRQA